MRGFFTFLVISIFSCSVIHAQDVCTKRYREKIFNSVTPTHNIIFNTKTLPGGATKVLRYDVYEPKEDTAALRPLVVLWHGGAFLDIFNKRSPDIVMMAHDLAKMGYVVISPDYRGIRDITSFLRTEDLVKEVVGAAIDGDAAICHILSEIDYGNPFRINKDEIFAGGVSGGAVLGLHLLLLQKTEDLPAGLVNWAREVDNGAIDELLANKHCGHPDIIKGFINISGALVDTSFIQPVPTTFLHIHGEKDDIVPYGVGQPLFGFTAAPDLYGSLPVHEKSLSLNMSTQLLNYEKLGHVPFLNLDLGMIISQLNIINMEVYEECMQASVDFLFHQITCEKEELATSLRPLSYIEMQFYPNPVSQSFQINMPESKQWQIQIFDLSGKVILQNSFNGNYHLQSTGHLNKGMYIVRISDLHQPNTMYTGKIIQQVNK